MSKDFLADRIKAFVVDLMKSAITRIPYDVYTALKKAYEEEDNPVTKKQLETILENIMIAREEGKPICQDTGTPYFSIEIGEDFPIKSMLYNILADAVREATQKIPLRPNAVDPITNTNSGDNTGRFIPWIDAEIVPGSTLKICFMAKGGGSEYPNVLAMIPPAKGLKGVREVVLKAVIDAGPKPCPPVIIGVGIAAGSDIALKLAKKSLYRPVGQRHEIKEVADLEEDLLRLINRLGIGAHGFGGKYTALDVKIDYAHRHPASFAVGVVFSCWATRRACGIIDEKGEARLLSRHL